MKKFDFKNCIAFTLAEMTLVLLITSIIAAAATPMITSSISGANGDKNADLAATYDTPWKSATFYNGGGIYNAPARRTSIISIGHKTGAAAGNYNYASLLVHQFSTNNFAKAPQIKIVPRNASSPTASYTNIAMDEFQNVAVTYGTSFQAARNSNSNTFMGLSNVFMGSYINPTLPGFNYKSSVFMGYGIDVLYAQYAINIGSNIYANNALKQTIFMGSNIIPRNNTTISDSIVMGDYAGYATQGDNNIIMGTYAGYASQTVRNIMIGSNAGYNFAQKSNLGVLTNDNIMIGDNAGFTSDFPNRPTSVGYGYNTYIGLYAGALIGTHDAGKTSPARIYRRNVMIGSYAGTYDFRTYSNLAQDDNIYIGNYAGYTKAYPSCNKIPITRRICIGYQACYNENVKFNDNNTISNDFSMIGNDSIYIGYSAGKEVSDVGNNIAIGNYAGSNTFSVYTSKDMISIGEYAGWTAHSMYSIFIGHNSGNGTKSISEAVGEYYFPQAIRLASLGIGNNTCKGISFGGKTCLGSGTHDTSIAYMDNSEGVGRTVWSKDSNGAQMMIGFVEQGIKNQSIIFYSNFLYRGGTAANGALEVPDSTSNYKFSDKRLKKDIVLSKHSLNDIRKINIRDFNYKNDPTKTKVTGIIAQEYKKVFPYDVTVEPTTKKLSAASDWLIYSLVNAVKDLDKEIIAVQNDVKAYIKDFMGLKSKIAKLEKQAEKIKAENIEMRNHLAKINAKLK